MNNECFSFPAERWTVEKVAKYRLRNRDDYDSGQEAGRRSTGENSSRKQSVLLR
jgi:hypothetical protein